MQPSDIRSTLIAYHIIILHILDIKPISKADILSSSLKFLSIAYMLPCTRPIPAIYIEPSSTTLIIG